MRLTDNDARRNSKPQLSKTGLSPRSRPGADSPSCRTTPNFFIVGAAKSGTTAFAEYLDQHPQVYMSPVKEPHYFCADIEPRCLVEEITPEAYFSQRPLGKLHALCIRDPEQYASLFESANAATAIGEASVSYLYSELAPMRISKEIQDPKILVFLRNPIERAYSHFRMDLDFGMAPSGDFLDAVELDVARPGKGWGVSNLYIELGLYALQLRRYLKWVSREQIRVYIYDDFRADVRSTLLDILSFLDVDPSLEGIITATRYGENPGKFALKGLHSAVKDSVAYRWVRDVIPRGALSQAKKFLSRKPRPIRRKEYQALVPYFRADVLELSEILGRDLSHWLRPA